MDDNQRSVQLLQNLANGRRESFDVFYEEHIGFVYNIAFSLVKNQTEAEDICHEVFLEVYQRSSQYNSDRGSVKAWLAVKTKSRALDRLRKKKPIPIDHYTDKVIGADMAADEKLLKDMEKKAVLDALHHIPNEQREAIYRSYFQEESHKEIASSMKKPLGSVKSLIRYGLNNLRKQRSILHWASGGGNQNE